MEFLGMGPMEILVVLIVGLIAVGPGKLPEFARNLSKGIRALRKATKDLTKEFTDELKELENEETSKQQPTTRNEKAASIFETKSDHDDGDDGSPRGTQE